MWRAGDGDDTIAGEVAGADVIWIGGYGSADVLQARVGQDLWVVWPGTRLTITAYFSGQNLVEQIQTELQ